MMKHLFKAFLTLLVFSLAVQSCCKEPPIPFEVSQDSFTVDKDGGSLSLTISSPSNWTISSDRSWLSVNPAGGSMGVSNKVTITVTPNTAESYRTGTLTIIAASKSGANSKNGSLSVTITQNGTEGGPSSNVNEWILSTLKDYYLWNDDIKKVKTPNMLQGYKEFLEELLLKADSSDSDGTIDGGWNKLSDGTEERYFYTWADEVPTYTRATPTDEFHLPTFGFDFAAWWVANDRIACFVTWVREGSPAYNAGLRRGMWIDKYNGKPMTTEDEYMAFVEAWFYDVVEGKSLYVGTQDGLSATITAEVMETNPLIVTPKVIDMENGKKVGYIVYNEFEDGPEDGVDGRTTLYKFDNYLRDAFATTLAGVDELVVDLRYNPGGYVSSCKILCALISGADSPEIFAKLAHNNRDSETNPSDNLCQIYRYKKEKDALTNLNRVFVLETANSASASEMVISSLRGIKGDDWVVHIGETTEDKNVGMNQFTKTIDEVEYEMWPITFKIHNAKGFADYANGFTPSFDNQIADVNPNWYGTTGGYELGDEREPLLKQALDIISGNTTRAAQVQTTPPDRSKLLTRPATRRGGLKIRAPQETAEHN
jgi:C-terminal processing protease CtpA/Prc